MKYANKYMVVPYTQTGGISSIENPEEAQINRLDQDMSNILAQKTSLDEKLKLYSQTLARFSSVYQPNTFSLPSVLAELATKTSANEQKINEKLDQLDVKLEKNKPQLKKRNNIEQILPEDLVNMAKTKRASKQTEKEQLLPEGLEKTKRVSKQTEHFQIPFDVPKAKKKKIQGEISDDKKAKKLKQKVFSKNTVIIKAKPRNPISELGGDTPLNPGGSEDFQNFEFADFERYVQ